MFCFSFLKRFYIYTDLDLATRDQSITVRPSADEDPRTVKISKIPGNVSLKHLQDSVGQPGGTSKPLLPVFCVSSAH